MASVVQTWVGIECSLKMQTVLLCALRGCDGLPKEDPSKRLVRLIRHHVLKNADPNTKFMSESDAAANIIAAAQAVTSDIDHYPVHWVTHFMHAAEILAYAHPLREVRDTWFQVYMGFCNALHVKPEAPQELEGRLS